MQRDVFLEPRHGLPALDRRRLAAQRIRRDRCAQQFGARQIAEHARARDAFDQDFGGTARHAGELENATDHPDAVQVRRRRILDLAAFLGYEEEILVAGNSRFDRGE